MSIFCIIIIIALYFILSNFVNGYILLNTLIPIQQAGKYWGFYDVKGKKYLETNKKYYLSDLSFRFATIGTKNEDIGHLYENIVAIELLRRGYEVYTGSIYNKEIDFVIIKNGIKKYIQVSYDLSNPKVIDRELKPLLSLKDGYEKIIIARTRARETNINGVRIIDIAR